MLDRRHLMKSALGAGILASLGCSSRKDEAAPKIRVIANLQPSSFGFLVAQEAGDFARLGLDIEIHRFAAGAQAVPLLAGGEMDVSFLPLYPAFVNAAAKGGQLRIVAGRDQTSTSCGDFGRIYGSRASFPEGLDDLGHLKGKRIAVIPAPSFSQFCLEAHLGSVGLTPQDVELVPLRGQESVTALMTGNVDALVLQHEYFFDFEKIAKELVATEGIAKYLPGFQFAFVVFGKNLLEGDRSIGAKFLAAYLQGARRYLDGAFPKMIERFAPSAGIDVNRIKAACRNTFPADGAIDKDSVEYYIDWAVQRGYCPERIELSQLVDASFLNQAQRLRVPVEASP